MTLRYELGGVEEDESEIYLARVRSLESAGRSEEAAAVLEMGRSRLLQLASRIRDGEWRERFLRDVASNRELAGR